MNKYLEKIAARIRVGNAIKGAQDAVQARDAVAAKLGIKKRKQEVKKQQAKKKLANGRKFNRRTMRKTV